MCVCVCARYARAYLPCEKGNYVLFVFLECACMCAYLRDSVLFVRVFAPRLTAKLELGWLLLWGVNLGLGGFPASLSLCRLLFMCCRKTSRDTVSRANKHLLYHRGKKNKLQNVTCWINNGYVLSLTEAHRNYITLLPSAATLCPPLAAVLTGLCPPGIGDVYISLVECI